MKQPVEHNYRIEVDDNDHSIRRYFLNDEPHEYVPPEKVSVGSLVYYDQLNEIAGIVVAKNRRDAFFQLYDVYCIETEKMEEVTEFQVYRITEQTA
jgi:hypothetical protein